MVTIMKEFDVEITETLQKTVTVEADSKEALRIVKDMWKNSDIILDAENFIDVEYTSNSGKEIREKPTIPKTKPKSHEMEL